MIAFFVYDTVLKNVYARTLSLHFQLLEALKRSRRWSLERICQTNYLSLLLFEKWISTIQTVISVECDRLSEMTYLIMGLFRSTIFYC